MAAALSGFVGSMLAMLVIVEPPEAVTVTWNEKFDVPEGMVAPIHETVGSMLAHIRL